MSQQKEQSTRRQFMGKSVVTGATAMAGFSTLSKYGYGANYDNIKVGVVGVGGRGSGAIRDILAMSEGVEVVALAEVNKENLDARIKGLKEYRGEDRKPLKGFNVTPDRCYIGLDAYKKICDDSDIDIVILTTPPGFRPAQYEYAINAGKHVFSEKPVGVDPVGIRRYMAAAKKAVGKGLGTLAGTQRRHQPSYMEMMKRIQDGQIGDVISAHVYWNGQGIWYRDRAPWMTTLDYWLYNWYHVDWMCGDHIVEQHLHNLDVGNWVMGSHPAKAYGMGGRQYWTERGGNIYDHFCAEIEYPDGRRITSMCRQIPDTDGKVAEDIIGTKGRSESSSGKCEIFGAKPWVASKAESRKEYQLEHRNFIQSLRAGNPFNEGQQVAESTMTAVMCREAAYTGKVITWDDMMTSDLDLMPKNLKTWNGELRPLPKPGMKRA
jgi:myo-inositol 2-dehydrogenase / D-chiro-inositol 1-dehydrogenase